MWLTWCIRSYKTNIALITIQVYMKLKGQVKAAYMGFNYSLPNIHNCVFHFQDSSSLRPLTVEKK